MIFDLILGGLMGVVRAVLALVPMWQPDVSGLEQGAETAGQWAGMLNGYFPVGALFIGVAIVWGYRLVLIVYRLITRAYELVPLKAT